MPYRNFVPICSCIAILLLGFELSVAQQVAGRPNPGSTENVRSGGAISQSLELDSRNKQNLDFIVRISGSVMGRIFTQSPLDGTGEDPSPTGIAGVKITLRSRDVGFENFRIEQFTDAAGSYTFQELRPGKYWIEFEPQYLPVHD